MNLFGNLSILLRLKVIFMVRKIGQFLVHRKEDIVATPSSTFSSSNFRVKMVGPV